MKKFLSILISFFALLLISAPAQAYYGNSFRAQAHVTFTNVQVTATIVNQSWRAVVCSGYAYGQTWSGNVYNGYMNNVVIYPGQYAYAQVYSNGFDQFVNGWSDIWCRYL